MSASTRLDELLSRWQEHLDRGEDLSPADLCGDCPELMPELTRRLEALRQLPPLDTPLDVRIAGLGDLAPASDSSEAVNCTVATRDTIPGYDLLAELGRGGMGVVYKARQSKLDRIVALKMILAGDHAGDIRLQRFRTEAEAIARLQHPNIVQIHEVGEDNGLPYFSLEFCGGGTLARKLRGTPLAPGDAAALVELLARAMHAAHEKGIIHRDLKPGNVLLAEDGTPKITDFGLARKLDSEPGMPTPAGLTITGDVMGTPSYMAPEQAEGRIQELGPACDIYALGAILYECLTGRPPFRAVTPRLTVQQVIDEEPVPPTQLQRHTPRDLETICLKCLQKEPAKRYPTAAALADDLCHFRNHEAITARPISAAERLVRWCRRRPLVAGLGVSLITVLAVGIPWLIALTVLAENRRLDAEEKRRAAETAEAHAVREKENAQQAQKNAEAASVRARTEAAKAREFSDLLLGVFESADPTGLQGYTFASAQVGSAQLPAREILNRAVKKIHDLNSQPEIQATQLTSIGNVYRSLGLYKQSGELLEKAYALRQNAYDGDREEIADSLYYLGWLYHEQGQYPRAKRYYEDALRIRTTLLGADSPKVTQVRFNLAWLAALTGDHTRSEELFLDVIARRQTQHGTSTQREVAVAKMGLAMLYLQTGHSQKVATPCREALAIFREVSARDKLAEAMGLFLTAHLFANARQHALAVTTLRKCLELAVGELGDNHPYVGIISYQMGDFLEAQNKLADAEKYYRDCVKIARTTVGLGHPKVVYLATSLGRLLNRKGAFDEATQLFDEVRKAHQERFGADHPLVADVLVPYASLLGTRSAHDRLKMLNEAVAIYETGEKRYGMKAASFKSALRDLSNACRQAASAGAGLQAAQTRKRIFPTDPVELYDTACELSLLVPLAEQDPALDAAGRKQLADQCAAHALDRLEDAVAHRFNDPLRLVLEPRLRPLGTQPRLETLLQKLPLDRSQLQVHHGALTTQDPFDSRCAQARCKSYPIRMVAGTTYQIDLLSADFDAYLRVENAAGREKAFDDDSGGDLNARLRFTPSEPGEYRVIVTTYIANQTGNYVLAIQQKK